MKTLMLLRGLPGAGKSTLAADIVEELGGEMYAADDWMVNDATGQYEFNAGKLGKCHQACRAAVEWDLSENVPLVIVHNTLTTEVEVEEYEILARRYNYKLVSLVVENRHGNKSVHNVPEATLAKYANRFSIKL